MSPEGDGAEKKKELPDYLQMVMGGDMGMLRKKGGVKGIATDLDVDIDEGCSDSTMEWRLKEWGKNQLPPQEVDTLWDKLLEQLEDSMIQLLCLTAIISLALNQFIKDEHGNVQPGGWIEGTAILVSVCIVATVSAVQEYEKELKFQELSACKAPKMVGVKRNGKNIQILSNALVMGDIMHLIAGDETPADGVFIEGQDLKADESVVTGENLEVDKSVEKPFLISGSNILEGECTCIVVGVGEGSQKGLAEMSNREKKPQTPLQERLEELSNQISTLGFVMALLTTCVLTMKSAYIEYVNGNINVWMSDYQNLFKVVVNNVMVGVTIVVVAIPEGLPLSVTIALAYSMKRMYKDNNLVRHLAACETMGSATQICSDKTGTLTQNKMTVVRCLFASDHHPRVVRIPTDREYNKDMRLLKESLSRDTLSILAEGLIMNSTATKTNNGFLGNKTECAMLEFIEGMDIDLNRVRERLGYHKSRNAQNRHTYPFSSQKKRMLSLLRLGSTMRVHAKGASELVLRDCERILIPNTGAVEVLTEDDRLRIKEQISEMARGALRTLLIAYSDRDGRGHEPFDKEQPDDKLIFVGILAIEDPMRPEVPEAVKRCNKAGITVRMVTGDNKATAVAIAKQAGIYRPKTEDIAMEGEYFRQLEGDKDKMTYVLRKLKVLARMTPIDKQILVQALRARGEVVAVTGDGTNDAPALKLADVGFAMDSGTEVAKGASDIVLLDDNFASVVTAAMWGRNINDNIRKFIQFQSTVNIAAVAIAFIGSVTSSNGESPLKPVQLLWLNLIMDSLAALALATEKPHKGLLDRPPASAESSLISNRMWLNMIGQAAYQIGLQVWLLDHGWEYFNVVKDGAEHLTVVFNTFVFLQVVNEFNARKIRNEINIFSGLMSAPLFLAIIVATVVIQYVCVQHVGAFMNCVPLNTDCWIKCLQFSIVPLPLGVLLRLIPVKEVQPAKPQESEVDYSKYAVRGKPLFDASRSKSGGRGRDAFKAAGKEVIQMIKISASLSTTRRRKRAYSNYEGMMNA